jgi:tetratricopeptide (TPR) repeat protein
VSRNILRVFVLVLPAGILLDGQPAMEQPLVPSFGRGAQGVSVLRGEVRNLSESSMDLAVTLSGMPGAPALRAGVDSDGTFELVDIPHGTYLLKLVHGRDQSLLEQMIHVQNTEERIILDLRSGLDLSPGTRQAPAATVSADQLRRPVSTKAAKLLRQAQSYAAAGDHGRAIEELNLALKEPSAIPYAHAMLGVEYLRTAQAAAAIEHLETASRMLPHDASIHSNFAYALFLTGDLDRAEREVRRALELDSANKGAQLVLGYIVKAQR